MWSLLSYYARTSLNRSTFCFCSWKLSWYCCCHEFSKLKYFLPEVAVFKPLSVTRFFCLVSLQSWKSPFPQFWYAMNCIMKITDKILSFCFLITQRLRAIQFFSQKLLTWYTLRVLGLAQNFFTFLQVNHQDFHGNSFPESLGNRMAGDLIEYIYILEFKKLMANIWVFYIRHNDWQG